ncbi:MAG: hypothetical protein AAB686_01730 [Patescibacteria group bacterium]
MKNRYYVFFGIGLALIAALLWWFYGGQWLFGSASPDVFELSQFGTETIHYAGDPGFKIPKIHVLAFYFVPKDYASKAIGNWKAVIEESFGSLVDFYRFQLREGTDIRTDLYPEPVIGELEHRFYDGEDTNRGNPNALLSIRRELMRRVLEPSGDLYRDGFIGSDADGYKAMAIIYEGVGAAATLRGSEEEEVIGGDTVAIRAEETPAFLVSRFFLTDEVYADYGLSVLAHEFAHILGLNDDYEAERGNPVSDDLMGAGMFRPLTSTYLSLDDKKQLGLSY